ncbi:DUF2993 domain-containing protein [Actinomadura rayongensis]|uniref:LmeA family phospholipid-binding protein n=1 Tax=Actinomadura rayongensis TaxID=1429076 RepID=A0A6I4W9R5_9ACTN|nr:DUF2993 domain-containing protein [Actinomadura rayongensis]MXQ64806.1 LmeA family phospholipid-binding protein [Actinomadura rayongensis]
MRKFLLVLLVLVVCGAVAGDRIGVRIAQNQIAERVQSQYGLAQRPDVTIHGIPFLTQALGGKYDRIDVRIGDWTERGVTVSDVTVDMRDVTAPLDQIAAGNSSGVVAGTATASAIVPYAAIKQNAPKEITSIRPDGDRLKVGLAGSILGFQLTGEATVKLKPTAQGIRVTPVSVGSSSLQIPVTALSWTVPIADLPVGSRISELTPTPGGLRVAATAHNVNLARVQAR